MTPEETLARVMARMLAVVEARPCRIRPTRRADAEALTRPAHSVVSQSAADIAAAEAGLGPRNTAMLHALHRTMGCAAGDLVRGIGLAALERPTALGEIGADIAGLPDRAVPLRVHRG